MKKNILATAAAVVMFVTLAAFTLRPVPVPEDEKECLSVTGTVSNIFEGGVKDVVIMLKDNPKTYYINRGLENGLDLEALRKELEGKEITIKYPDYWSLLDPGKKLLQISKIEHDGKTVYNEIQ